MKNTLLLILSCIFTLHASSQTIVTIAGTGTAGYTSDGIQATASALNNPYDVGMDTWGNLYVGDAVNNRIRKIDPSGVITTIAGSGVAGYNGEGISATAAQFNFPYGMAVNPGGSIVISDMNNNRVRTIKAEGYVVFTIGGTGVAGYSGDGGPATAAMINNPQGVFWDAAGNVFFSDALNNRVRKISNTGIITTVGGNGTASSAGDGGPATAAGINHPSGLAVDTGGNIYVAEMYGNRLRKISASGTITTVAGTGAMAYGGDGGPATAAQIRNPKGVCIDKLGNIIIADTDNLRIRKIDITTGIITTIAGTGLVGYSGDGGPATAAKLNFHQGVFVDTFGNIYTGDCLNHRVRKIVCEPPVVAALAGPDTVCIGSNITLTSATPGGSWTSLSGHASVAGGTVTGNTTGLDTIQYTVANSCLAVSVTRPVYVKACVTFLGSVNAVQGVSIYPNPATNELTVTATYDITEVTLTDISGKTVISNTCSARQAQLDITHLAAGVYLVKINGTWSGRFVKN